MYRVRLDQFEGPLDLLLFFIRRDELDIYDIPIARIADEYLAYVRVLEQVDLDSVGDFLFMAALLISIKARMLLPRQNIEEDGDPIDPRQELVERLLEYIRFREAAQQLVGVYEERLAQYTRGTASRPELQEAGMQDALVEASVFDLVSALRRILTATEEQPKHAIIAEAYSVEEQQAYLLANLPVHGRVSFRTFVLEKSKAFVIATFLAVLELVRNREVTIIVRRGANDFHLSRTSPGERAEENGTGSNGLDEKGGRGRGSI